MSMAGTTHIARLPADTWFPSTVGFQDQEGRDFHYHSSCVDIWSYQMNIKNPDEFEEENVTRVYDLLAPFYKANKAPLFKSVEQFIMSLPPKSMVLDVGCGSGRYLGINKYITVIGLDSALEQCKVASNNNKVSTIQGNALKLPFKDQTFDHVICINAIHHLSTEERRAQCLREIGRVLRIGGTALVTARSQEMNEEEDQDTLEDWEFSRKLIKNKKADLSRFFHYFDLNEFETLISKTEGLELLEEDRVEARVEVQIIRL